MAEPILFICQSCTTADPQKPTAGSLLLERLQQAGGSLFTVKREGCLWDCDRGCVVAFACLGKPTYLFTNLSGSDAALALIQFGELYSNCESGDVAWKHFPEELKAAGVSRIPTV